MDEMKMEESNEAEERDLNGQEEVIDEEKKGKPLFPLPIVFGAGIAAFLIVAAVFAGRANLESQLKVGIGATVTPEVSEEPDTSGLPPCPGEDPNNPPKPSGGSFSSPWSQTIFSRIPDESSPESDDPNASISPEELECKEFSNCWTDFEGTRRPFLGEQECIPNYCEPSEERDTVNIKKCQFKDLSKDFSCDPVPITVTNKNYGCYDSDPAANCPDMGNFISTDTACLACSGWGWDEQEWKDVIKAKCITTKQEKVPVTDKCEKVEEGREGWTVDRSSCGYDITRVNDPQKPGASACFQSCQVFYKDEDKNCEGTWLSPGECRLERDGPPPGTPVPSGVPVV